MIRKSSASLAPSLKMNPEPDTAKHPSAPQRKPLAAQIQLPMDRQRIASNDGRPASNKGRSSPIKRLGRMSMASIPESFVPPKTRAAVTFTIDPNGRARTETTLVVEEAKTSRGGPQPADSDLDSYHSESSSDDDPIILPSQKNSFAIPEKLPKLARFDTGRRNSGSTFSQSSVSEQSLPSNDQESEAETVMDDDDGKGDAAVALRKVMERRQQSSKLRLSSRHHLHSSGASTITPRHQRHQKYASSSNISPTTVTDPDLATPSTDRQSTSTRCVCNNPDGEGFMIQCESCDKWQHGRCVGVSRHTLPPVWICAFCAQTPNMRGGRIREAGKGGAGGNSVPQFGSSPLAHKSFKSFR